MNDEGVGIAGWLLADLVLVLAIVFLAFTPAAQSDEPGEGEAAATATPTPTPVAPPVIIDIGCEERAAVSSGIPVRCEPRLGGGEVRSYRWEADGGHALTNDGSDRFAATFSDAGAVRLAVENEGGEHRAAFPVLPPRVITPAGALVVEDFRFDQIVLENVGFGEASWDIIAAGRVREKLDKSREDKDDEPSERRQATTVTSFLQAKLGEGFRITLVETFSHEPRERHLELSDQVNEAFYAGLLREMSSGTGSIGGFFVDCEAREKWFAKYRDTRLPEGEVRINLYWVRPHSPKECP